MKKVIALTIPLVVLVVTVTTLVMSEVQRTPDWKSELEAYIEAQAVTETLTVQTVVEAEKPWNFTAHMGLPVRASSTWGTVEEIPYPPSEVKCVLLARQGPSPAESEIQDESVLLERQIVYVSYHSDNLWHVGWLAHEGVREPFSTDVKEDLATIGCDLPLE
jgi:hypothetical protein